MESLCSAALSNPSTRAPSLEDSYTVLLSSLPYLVSLRLIKYNRRRFGLLGRRFVSFEDLP